MFKILRDPITIYLATCHGRWSLQLSAPPPPKEKVEIPREVERMCGPLPCQTNLEGIPVPFSEIGPATQNLAKGRKASISGPCLGALLQGQRRFGELSLGSACSKVALRSLLLAPAIRILVGLGLL